MPSPDVDEETDRTDDDSVATEASNKALEVTIDFIIKRLKNDLDAYQFGHFVAHLLECSTVEFIEMHIEKPYICL